MKKVLFIMGSPRKGETLKVTRLFEQKLKERGEIQANYIFLKDYNLQICKGCFVCLKDGEEKCPLKGDDRDRIINAMEEADGVVFTSPNYSLQVTAIMKNFLDRLAFVFHRPMFFNKVFTSIVTQGVFGGDKINKYLDETATFWGFKTTKGMLFNTPPGIRLPKDQKKIENIMEKGTERFYRQLVTEKPFAPALGRIAMFRMVRSFQKHGISLDKDYQYFKDSGWLENEYYYDVKLGVFKRTIGNLIDNFFKKIALKSKREVDEYKANNNL